MSSKIIVFIPMYNCQDQIIRVLTQFDSNVKQYIEEILIVNNRSTDNGEAVAIEKMQKIEDVKVTLLRNVDNYGLGGSHKVAFDYGLKNNYDYLIVLHGDDQGDIREIVPYLQKEEYKNYDCLLGARFHRDSKLEGYSWFRTFGNRVYNFLFSLVAGRKIFDLGSGLNMYKLEIFKNGYHTKFPDDLTFNYCMILGSIYRKQKLRFFPLTWREDDQVSNVKLTRQAVRVLNLLRMYGSNRKKFMLTDHRVKVVAGYHSELIYSNLATKGLKNE
ncbi:glycosyltransferase family 2 protein [Paenibacillus camerounensis]|uniref:glycosyltransferase family 2 protein n=1 Tax=Paenibacillus camerounensis TaxID=1243663 RepID=UPI0005A6FC15|nr:glycosyltransferase family 2 protein [Paenibacillus camerounensis]